nr:TMEM175 family protein [uncultured Sphingorhabdus sp.]
MSNISKERVGAISDGVIAVAATLLVLELKVPEGTIEQSEVMLHWSRLMAAWLISFAMIAMVWFDNHLFLVKAPRWTARMTIVTFAQLAAVSLIPFVCDLAVDHYQEIEAIIAFNLVMLINGIISVTLSRMIAADIGRDESSVGDQYLKRRAQLQLRIYVVILAIAVAGAFLHRPFLGVLLWGFSPLMIRYFLGDSAADEIAG